MVDWKVIEQVVDIFDRNQTDKDYTISPFALYKLLQSFSSFTQTREAVQALTCVKDQTTLTKILEMLTYVDKKGLLQDRNVAR